MLELCTAATLPSLDLTQEAGVRIAAQVEAYGLNQPFFLVYKGADGSVLSILDHAATLLAGDDPDEVFCFLQMSPEITSLRTDKETAIHFAAERGFSVSFGAVLKAPTTVGDEVDAAVVSVTPADYYPLAKAVFLDSMLPFDGWYADVTHRVRRGCCRLCGIVEDDKLVSGAMTVAQTQGAWLLGTVCTDPAFRRRGYAAACVTALAKAGTSLGNAVMIAAKNPSAKKLYESLGFTVCGEWGQVDFFEK